MSDTSQGAGWWLASDGKWYPPEQRPNVPPPVSTWFGKHRRRIEDLSPDDRERTKRLAVADAVEQCVLEKPPLTITAALAGLVMAAGSELADDERVLAVAIASIEIKRAARVILLTLTESRLVYAMEFKGQQIESTPLDEIWSIETELLVLTPTIVITNPHGLREVLVHHYGGDYMAAELNRLRADQQPSTVERPSLATELAELASLHQQGLLSADEFDAAKRKLLAE